MQKCSLAMYAISLKGLEKDFSFRESFTHFRFVLIKVRVTSAFFLLEVIEHGFP